MKSFLPKAREKGLIVQELPSEGNHNEVLVYDTRCHHALHLSPAAVLVWKICDGRTSVAEAASLLSEKLGLPNDPDVVRHALAELSRHNLLEEVSDRPFRISRRDLVKRFGLSAAAALPLITMTVAPTPAAASSGGVTGATGSPPSP